MAGKAADTYWKAEWRCGEAQRCPGPLVCGVLEGAWRSGNQRILLHSTTDACYPRKIRHAAAYEEHPQTENTPFGSQFPQDVF